jgi:Xaa-Pro aminopeptidase
MRRMKFFKSTAVAAAFLVSSNAGLPAASAAGGSGSDAAEPAAIRVAPAAPVITDAERQAELAGRRARVAEKIGPKSILVMFSAEPRVYTNDVDYEFRQENNLYYLTNLRQAGATLVMIPGSSGPKEVLFLPKRDPRRETWTGYMYSAEEARRISGINEIYEDKEFQPFMQGLRTRRAYRPAAAGVLMSASAPPVPKGEQTPAGGTTPNAAGSNVAASAAPSAVPAWFEPLFQAMTQNEGALYLNLPPRQDPREFRQEQEFAAEWAKAATGLGVKSAWPIFVELRSRKSPFELKLLQHAVDISIEAHGRAQAVAPRAKWEYEVEAEIDYTYKRRNADNWGYPNIVGCGPNATTLHYVESQGEVKPTDLILIDSAAEYDHYTADVTRTFPAGGKFSPAQAEIYNIVLAAQEASFRASKPGSTIGDVHNASVEVIKDGLLRLGLITDRNSDQYRMWFMHGTSHWLGMNVHDVGMRGGKLEPGNVYTVEPGIYIRLDALDYLPDTPESKKFLAAVRPAFEKYKGIGVRIEDDIVITDTGYRNMSAALPRTIPEIEAFMAKAQKEVRADARPAGHRPRGAGSIFVGSPMQFAALAHRHGHDDE